MDFGPWLQVAGYWMLDTGNWKKWLKAQGARLRV
jgi:hypothetical protein